MISCFNNQDLKGMKMRFRAQEIIEKNRNKIGLPLNMVVQWQRNTR